MIGINGRETLDGGLFGRRREVWRPSIVANRVTKGTTSITLRDAVGRPMWHLADAGAD